MKSKWLPLGQVTDPYWRRQCLLLIFSSRRLCHVVIYPPYCLHVLPPSHTLKLWISERPIKVWITTEREFWRLQYKCGISLFNVLKFHIYWDITPCSLVSNYRPFGITCCFRLQGQSCPRRAAETLQTEAACFCVTVSKTTRCHNPTNHNPEHTSPLISEFLQVVPTVTSEFIFCYVMLRYLQLIFLL
jgi:hypothetical protein